jgi:hypothetical protein
MDATIRATDDKAQRIADRLEKARADLLAQALKAPTDMEDPKALHTLGFYATRLWMADRNRRLFEAGKFDAYMEASNSALGARTEAERQAAMERLDTFKDFALGIVERIGVEVVTPNSEYVSATYQGRKRQFKIGERVSIPLTGMDLTLVRYADGTFGLVTAEGAIRAVVVLEKE